MASQPSTNNALVGFIDGLVDQLSTGGVDVAEAYIAAQAPILEMPGISILMNALLNAIADAITTETKAAVAKIVIGMQANVESANALQAAQDLKNAQASGNQNAISAASASFDNAIGALVHSDGSVAPSA